MKLESYVAGRWVAGSGEGRPFVNPTTGEILGRVDDTGVDPFAAIAYGRSTGTPALRALSFEQRGNLLRAIADVLTTNRDRYFEIARLNSGNTKVDASIDIDGGIGTLKTYARYAKSLGGARTIVEPGQEQLAKDPTFFAAHVWTSRPGVALQINAFNFPSWGMWEKVSTALLAGVASIAKPASATAWLANEMVRDVIAANVLPAGALSLVCGSGARLVDALGLMDSLAFTGSAATGLKLRSGEAIQHSGARITIEADSINATVIGPDVAPGSAVFELARREIGKALTVKAGQLCTNIRRVFVPAEIIDALADAVVADAGNVVIGDPADERVRMGPLVDGGQRSTAIDGIDRLKSEARVLAGGGAPDTIVGADARSGAFLASTVLRCDEPASATVMHDLEVFGPCLTLAPYRSTEEAAALVARGGGSLAMSLFSDDADVQAQMINKAAAWSGRVLVVDSEVGKSHTGHSIVMPQCVHGGPGRAGGGEELGGLRGLHFHMQRSAVQGGPGLFERLRRDGVEATL